MSQVSCHQTDKGGRLDNDLIWKHGARKTGWWGKKRGAVPDKHTRYDVDESFGTSQVRGWTLITVTDYIQ